jgi:hypothetical protein
MKNTPYPEAEHKTGFGNDELQTPDNTVELKFCVFVAATTIA